jgi:two-component system alkaline phosphatase synthesis response regulator PhoP
MFKRKRALIIDDSDSDAEMMRDHLAKMGLKTYVSPTGADGLKMARKLKPELVLLDLILPDIDGFDVCDELKKDKALEKTKIIIISVKSDVEKIAKVLHIKADDYVIKNLMGEIPEDLTEKVKLHLGLN